jgi:hypothetical protein
LNRFTAKLVRGSARLAFWRKPAATPPDDQEAPEASTHSTPPELTPDAATEVPPPGRFARLKQALRWRRRPPAEEAPDLAEDDDAPILEPGAAGAATADETPAPKLSLLTRLKNRLRRQAELPAEVAEPADAAPLADQTLASEPPILEPGADAAAEDEAPAPKRSLLARLASRLRRQPAIPDEVAADADAFEPEPEHRRRDESADDDSDGDEIAEPVSRGRRVLALLSNKWVWIPGVGAVLLVLVGAMTLMLLQSAQEKKHLQEELLATQKKLQQTVTKKAAAKHDGAGQAGDAAVTAVADSSPGVDVGDCTVTDKESVILNLKNCIDSFNQLQN